MKKLSKFSKKNSLKSLESLVSAKFLTSGLMNAEPGKPKLGVLRFKSEIFGTQIELQIRESPHGTWFSIPHMVESTGDKL